MSIYSAALAVNFKSTEPDFAPEFGLGVSLVLSVVLNWDGDVFHGIASPNSKNPSLSSCRCRTVVNGIVSTGQWACAITLCAVAKGRCVAAARWPEAGRTPSTIRSAWDSEAFCKIHSAGEPNWITGSGEHHRLASSGTTLSSRCNANSIRPGG